MVAQGIGRYGRRLLAVGLLILLASLATRADVTPAPANSSPSSAAPGTVAPSVVTPSPIDHQAAYCLRAEFGFAQRLTSFIEAEQVKLDQLRAASADTTLDAAKRERVASGIAALAAKIKTSETERTLHEARLKKAEEALSAHGLTKTEGLQAIEIDTASAKEDEEASQSQYRGCISACQAADPLCKQNCRAAAATSEANQRLISCDDFVEALP